MWTSDSDGHLARNGILAIIFRVDGARDSSEMGLDVVYAFDFLDCGRRNWSEPEVKHRDIERIL